MSSDSSFSMILTLGVAGLVSGLAIVGVYEITLPRIERNRAEALQRAVFEVVPHATTMERVDFDDGAVYAAHNAAGELLGYAIPAKGPGFQDTISLLYGYDPARDRVIGMRVLESRETPGLGDKIIKDEVFVAQFEDLVVEPDILAVKKGKATTPNEIDAITGATISSKAVVEIINASNDTWLERLQ
ncbi:MAG TPA: RnfABCDGE type electron transport complex subunit G [Myxococcota bacterium]|nr:RnfABCDGE type electron transport complex subunit G [Myxococcota bacterium]